MPPVWRRCASSASTRRRFVVDEGAGGTVEVEAVLSEGQAAKLQKEGVDLEVKTIDGVAASEALEHRPQQGWDAFRPYGTPGGIKDEILATAAAFRRTHQSRRDR